MLFPLFSRMTEFLTSGASVKGKGNRSPELIFATHKCVCVCVRLRACARG